jgi:hypothetical protein
MLQIHPNARTTPATRAEIAHSFEQPSGVLARRYGVSAETIHKWHQRGPALTAVLHLQIDVEQDRDWISLNRPECREV